MCSTGSVIGALKYQLGWGTEQSTVDFFTTVLSTSATAGVAIGSLFGGDFVREGRRKTII